jgi:hypothetical protein
MMKMPFETSTKVYSVCDRTEFCGSDRKTWEGAIRDLVMTNKRNGREMNLAMVCKGEPFRMKALG